MNETPNVAPTLLDLAAEFSGYAADIVKKIACCDADEAMRQKLLVATPLMRDVRDAINTAS